MRLNFIENAMISGNDNVHLKDEDILFVQPDKPKEKLGMFNYWNEKKRSKLSDNAKCFKLVLDYDDGLPRIEFEDKFKDYKYIIYNSTGNDRLKNVEKFRVILDLSAPILAQDLRWWRNKKEFIDYFKGVDFSSFAVGRFFYRPSKYDKGGDEVKILEHGGELFDFYKLFPHHEVNQMWENLVRKIQFDSRPLSKGDVKKLKVWLDSEYPDGVHRCDVPRVHNKAVWMNVDLLEAEQLFKEKYVGHSDWQKWWNSIK